MLFVISNLKQEGIYSSELILTQRTGLTDRGTQIYKRLIIGTRWLFSPIPPPALDQDIFIASNPDLVLNFYRISPDALAVLF